MLAALSDAPIEGLHGYDLTQRCSIKSGTLYPLLMRLTSLGYLDSQWQEPVAIGRPPRQAYRLTAAGRQLIASTDIGISGLEQGAT